MSIARLIINWIGRSSDYKKVLSHHLLGVSEKVPCENFCSKCGI